MWGLLRSWLRSCDRFTDRWLFWIFFALSGKNPWQVLQISTENTFSDIAFTADGSHGWLVGSNSTLLESHDRGDTWEPRHLDLDEKRYTLTSVSFEGSEGWITGQPNLLLHTNDEGATWARVSLSEQLPGSPFLITALGPDSAEMATDIGAIYVTQNGGRNWKALVEGAVGVVRNMARSRDGRYVAVSSRGNFYSTWQPGQRSWQLHNRENSKRLQNMGFNQQNDLWLIARGGQLQFSASADVEDWQDPINPEFSTSWGLLDMAYRTRDEVWVAGGGGNLLCSLDGGKTWLKDRQLEDVPSNFYRIIFLSEDRGFVLGQRGILLKYDNTVEAA
ncbi:MAG: photosynthesis system II assembly factor Ycf48 [Leptolyngbyaceae cyanobacterium SM1_1_3]|nr:photosynthesis system II assembly factor Ycf48 [Leptolyngbyaceae cyanobacterium SM1_1_3]NJM84876.1 photosynthesis system II assembly factor Ycf48 [Leptolyngbyaceae cyanobacterium RM2_2_21]